MNVTLNKAVKLLFEKGSLPDECSAETPVEKRPLDLTKPELRDIAWAVIDKTLERCRGKHREDAEVVSALDYFVLAAAKLGVRSFVLGAAMVTRLHYFGPPWITDALAKRLEFGVLGTESLKTCLKQSEVKLDHVNKVAGIK